MGAATSTEFEERYSGSSATYWKAELYHQPYANALPQIWQAPTSLLSEGHLDPFFHQGLSTDRHQQFDQSASQTPNAQASSRVTLQALQGFASLGSAMQQTTALPSLNGTSGDINSSLSTFHPSASSRMHTLLIFDWDDTLMCSSAVNSNQFPPQPHSELENLIEEVLLTSMSLGETLIVTNADEIWVRESTRCFVPRILPLLSRINVISARRLFEQAFPGDVFAWKRETFREILKARQSSSRAGINLVVLGDSLSEMDAAQTSTVGLATPFLIKTVKFKESPCVDDVLAQLRMVLKDLGSIVAETRNSSRQLVDWLPQRPSLQQMKQAQLVSYASYGFPSFAANAALPERNWTAPLQPAHVFVAQG